MHELLERALEIATKAHNGQVDKSGAVYIFHPIRVAPDLSDASPKISYMSNKDLICPCSSVRNKVLLMILPLGSFT